jgi:hypothetical protein
MEFKAQREQVFEYDKPKPDIALLQIEKLQFGKDKTDPSLTVCSGGAKIIDSIEHADNVDLSMPFYFRLGLINDKPFAIEQFMGFLEAVTGETPQVTRADHFDDVRVQAKIQDGLPNLVFGASIVPNEYEDKKSKKWVEKVRFGTFYTKVEFMEQKSKGNSGSGVADAAAETGGPTTTKPSESKYF